MTTGNSRPPFDENAVLEELERLREEIRRARAHREQKIEEFEAWVRANRNTARVERIAALENEAAAAAPARAARAATRASQPAAQSSAAAASTPLQPLRPDPGSNVLVDPRALEPRRGKHPPRVSRHTAYYAGAAVIVIGALLVARPWSGGGPEPSQTEATLPGGNAAPAGSASGTSAATRTGTAARSAGPRRPLEIELTTSRPVWMRVTVDGERRVEREVPAGQRLTFGADRAIVLRVGDGGAVRLNVGGRDEGPLGGNGQIAVRTLTPKQP